MRLQVHPTLPHWLADVRLDGLQVGRTRLSIRFWREAEVSRCEVLSQDGPPIEVVNEPWTPWLTT